MTLDEVMQELESMGSAQTRKTWTRHGVTGPQFGVKYGDMSKLRKRIKTDHTLARELWNTGNHDARILATQIADPHQLTPAELETWLANLDNSALTDGVAGLAHRTAFATDFMDEWMARDHEWIETLGWNQLSYLAANDKTLPDEFFHPYLDTIETDVHNRKNYVRYAMNGALINIGLRSDSLRAHVTAMMDTIGEIYVDHGQTGCETPDVCAYIEKTLAYRRARQEKVKPGSGLPRLARPT